MRFGTVLNLYNFLLVVSLDIFKNLQNIEGQIFKLKFNSNEPCRAFFNVVDNWGSCLTRGHCSFLIIVPIIVICSLVK